MHVFPQLRKLEQKYQRELAVVSVHSAKFPAERLTENVRQAALRYRIEHPVVNDVGFDIWDAYACRAWPTMYLIDPRGRIMARHEGEINLDEFDQFIGKAAQEFQQNGLLDLKPLSFHTEAIRATPLRFPGKVLADAASNRLFIADSNHHRIVVTTLDGQVCQVIGDGAAGLKDGDFATAQFDGPQGVALVEDTLFVADTENHCLRVVSLDRGRVMTLAGVGEQARGFHQGGPARDAPLNSPWDVAYHDMHLFVAMAGFHQLWSLDLRTGVIAPHAGSGREGLYDGLGQSAMLAQPSGLTTDGRRLYFVDSETSSVRMTGLAGGDAVQTIVGQDLFVFGDVDGVGDDVRLQHPLGVAHYDGALYVVDSYNHKVKRVSPAARTSVTYLGSGEAGATDGPLAEARLHEPGGLSIAGGRMYIADTNNHAIRVVDMVSGKVRTLEIRGL